MRRNKNFSRFQRLDYPATLLLSVAEKNTLFTTGHCPLLHATLIVWLNRPTQAPNHTKRLQKLFEPYFYTTPLLPGSSKRTFLCAVWKTITNIQKSMNAIQPIGRGQVSPMSNRFTTFHHCTNKALCSHVVAWVVCNCIKTINTFLTKRGPQII